MPSNHKHHIFILILSISFFVFIAYINRNNVSFTEEGIVTKVVDGDTIIINKD